MSRLTPLLWWLRRARHHDARGVVPGMPMPVSSDPAPKVPPPKPPDAARSVTARCPRCGYVDDRHIRECGCIG